MKLRDYQTEALEDLTRGFHCGHRKQILTMPTGSGKTATAADLIRIAIAKGRRCLFVVHRLELIGQTVRHLDALGIRTGILQGDNTCYTDTDECIVATIQTINKRSAPAGINLILIDECHVLYQAHFKLIDERYDQAWIIGLTATPLRPDLGKHFDRMVIGASIARLTEAGHLASMRAFAPRAEDMERLLDGVRIDHKQRDFHAGDLGNKLTTKKIIGDVVNTWMEKAANRKTLLFACNVAHAETLCDAFEAEGIRVAAVSYRTPDDQRRQIADDFRAGKIQMLTSVDVLAIGFDVPDADCAIMARPTLSEIVYLQQAGRILRPAEGKTDALLLDHAGNSLRFGLPIDFIPPKLGGAETRFSKNKLREHKARTCANCAAVLPPVVDTCPECGHDQPGRKSRVEVTEGILVESGKTSAPQSPTDAEKLRWYLGLRFIARQRRHNPKAAAVQFKDKFGYWPPRVWNRIDPVPPAQDIRGWHTSHMIRYARGRAKQTSQRAPTQP